MIFKISQRRARVKHRRLSFDWMQGHTQPWISVLKSGISESAADTLHALDKDEEQDLGTKSGNPVDSDTSQHYG